jgi:hypothetical protein
MPSRTFPQWLIYGAAGAFIAWVLRLIFVSFAESHQELHAELKRVHARIVLLDNAVTAKLNAIESRLPEEE